MNYYLGIDNGGTTTKAALFDEQGRQAGAAEEFTQAVYPQPGFAERDMEEMWEANCRVIRRVIESTGIDPAQIRAAAVCGHGKGLYLWGQDNAPVRAGILSADNRAYSYPAAWRADGREKAVSAYTCQHIMACQPIPLLAWLRDHEPESLRHIKYIFSCKDYIRFRLTGGAYAERTDYSGSGLLNLYTGEYDARILGAFGLEKLSCALPPLKNAADLCGYVTEEAAKRTGLRAGTPVAGGMFDIDACALSAAVSGPNQVCMAAGTWSINECILPHPIADGRVLMNSLFCLPGWYLIEESSATSAANLAWYLRNLAPEADDIYREINREAASVSPEDSCPIFLPFIMASNVHPNAKGSFVGITAYHTRAHMVRSIYEGIAFSHRWHYEKLRRCMDSDPDSIRLTGGAARSNVWVQIFADVLKLPVRTSSITETGAHGCAIAAAAAMGDYNDIPSAVNAMTHLSDPVLPQSQYFAAYDKKYSLYKRVIEALEPVWDSFL